MARETDTDVDLDALFAEAREDAPSDALMARVLADADAVQAEAVAVAAAPAPARRRGWVAGLVESFGGWGTIGGVTAAGVMGLSLGLYAPTTVADILGAETLGLETAYDITPDMTGLWGEGDDV